MDFCESEPKIKSGLSNFKRIIFTIVSFFLHKRMPLCKHFYKEASFCYALEIEK